MIYKPNFNDPRVIKRTKQAYAFTLSAFSTTKPKSWAQSVLRQHFGKQKNQLTDYLRDTLLICTDHHYSMDTGKVKKYIANAEGLELIGSILNGSTTVTLEQKQLAVYEHLKEQWAEQLETKQFVYKDKSQRLWHSLQNVKREYKTGILNNSGLTYHYDISTAAPCLIYQHALHLGMDVIPMALLEYLENKKQIRQRLANELEVDVSVVKKIITSLFSGAIISVNPYKSVYKDLDGDIAKITLLKQDPFLKRLKADIKDCWSYIEPTILNRNKINMETGRVYTRTVKSKDKWRVYFQLERSVLSVVRDYLAMHDNDCFLEHDGWSTAKAIDLCDLTNHIKEQLDFDIVIDEKVCEIVSDDVEAIADVNQVVIDDEQSLFKHSHATYPSVLQVEETVTATVTPKRNANAERQKRYRERQRLAKLTEKGN